MRKPKFLSVRGTSLTILLAVVICFLLPVLLSSCSPKLSLMNESQQEENLQPEIRYSIIFIIHGDGDYLYLDTNNDEHNADVEAVMNAKKVAKQNPDAEVFIFHLKPKKHFLLFFPLQDGEFYYYRNGQLVANELYWRDQKRSNFDFEAEVYHKFHIVNQNKLISMFLYFGHEIPEIGGAGYDESYPDRSFNIDNLTSGMKSFTSDSIKFDLTVLSTCYGGTPNTINKLIPFTKTIIASPENLYLSYFDLSPLDRLDLNLKDGNVLEFAKRFALQSFDVLTSNIQTTVSVVVYDAQNVKNFVNSVQKDCQQTLNSLSGLTRTDQASIEHCDCADIPAYHLLTIDDGVDVFYRPAKFGRLKNKQSHSGWECWKY